MGMFDPDKALAFARKLTERKVIIKDYSIDSYTSQVNITLQHDKNGETHSYIFTGNDMRDVDMLEIQEMVDADDKWVLGLGRARRLWDILVANCQWEHIIENRESLWE
jgi:hypothetical protein